jgi:hypothetical protein
VDWFYSALWTNFIPPLTGVAVGDEGNRAYTQPDGSLAARLAPTEALILDRPVATQRLKRNLGLEICCKPSSCRHLRIPPSKDGIHLKQLSDFLGPPHGLCFFIPNH